MRQGLGCGLDARGCGSDMDNRDNRSSAHSILEGVVGSGLDNKEAGVALCNKKN